MLNIPKEFQLFGEKIKVKLVKLIDRGDTYGSWDMTRNQIKVATKDRTEDAQYQTYLHEVTHAILNGLSYDHLSNDEKFVDTFAKALHQVLISSVYE